MPLAATPEKVVISFALSALRRMIISGADSAITASEDVGPDLADDFAHARATGVQALQPGERYTVRWPGRAGEHCRYPVIEQRFHPQPADQQPGEDRYQQPEPDVEGGNLPAEHAEEAYQGDFIDHRCRDQEGKGETERHAGGEKTDEPWHRRA